MRFLGHVCTCRILGKVSKSSIFRVWSRAELPSDLTWGRDPDVGGRFAPPTPRAALATYPGAQGPYSFFCRPYCGRNIGKTEEYPQDKSGGRWIVRKQSWPPQVHPRDFSGKKSRLSDLALIVHTSQNAQNPAKPPFSFDSRALPSAGGTNKLPLAAGTVEVDPQVTSYAEIELLLWCLDLLANKFRETGEMVGGSKSPPAEMSGGWQRAGGVWYFGASEGTGWDRKSRSCAGLVRHSCCPKCSKCVFVHPVARC